MSALTVQGDLLLTIAKRDYAVALREADKALEALIAEDPTNVTSALAVQGTYFQDIWWTTPKGN